jgi:hypothetical protein
VPYHGISLNISHYQYIMKVTTTVSLDESTLASAKAFASAEKRSFSNLLEIWIAEKLAEIEADKEGATA